jgi:hypothetical protein
MRAGEGVGPFARVEFREGAHYTGRLMGPTSTRLLLFSLILATGSVCFAQGKASPNAERKKGSCDYITQAEAESILGTAAELRGDSGYGCWFAETGWTKEGPKNRSVRLNVWNWASPQVNWYADTRKKRTATQVAGKVVKDVPDFADAAIWTWVSGNSVFDAFKGGTIWVEVAIYGLPEADALQKAKQLATKVLGGTAGTGYVYAAPKSEAPMVAENKPAPAPTPTITETKPAPPPAPTVPIPIGTGKSFSQSRYMSQGEFLKAVKEVALTFEAAPSLEKYISAAEQRSTIESELAKYGITVRPNAPVALLATIIHKVSVYTKTYGGGPSSGGEEFPIHGLTFGMKFFVRAAALRNGKFHLVAAAPAYCNTFGTVTEGTDFQKAVHGDSTLKEMREEFRNDVAVCLKGIATNMRPETKPWSVMSWTEKDKASVDAEFTKMMGGQAAIDKRQLDGLDTAPELFLEPTRNGDFCTAPDPSWRDLWTKAFQRVGLTDTRGEPTLLLSHEYDCYFTYGFTAHHYFRVFDIISLVERNLVFELDGEVVRKAGELLSANHHTYMLEKDMESPTQNYFPRGITDFLVDLAFGNGNAPPIAVSGRRP